MTAPLDLEYQMVGLLDSAIEMWRKDGCVMTCSYALGYSAHAFAQPYVTEGAEIALETRVALHALIASCVNARYIGRIDESWVRLSDVGEPDLVHGDLERMADYDPRVATAICVQAYDLETGDSYLHMATLTLNDDGSQLWHKTFSDEVEGRIVGGSELTARAIPILSKDNDLTFDVVESFLNAVGWTMAVASAEVGE
jgi:hypothetical protein